MRFTVASDLALVVLPLTVACSSSDSGSSLSSQKQALTGQVERASFAGDVTEVRVIRNATVVASSPLDAAGGFSILVPPGTGYRLEVLGASGLRVGLVFPRKAGQVDNNFSILRGGAAFDLGAIRYVGDASSQSFNFGAAQTSGVSIKTAGTETTGDPAADTSGESSGDSECEDGRDASNAVCVDDNDDEHAGSCEGVSEPEDSEADD